MIGYAMHTLKNYYPFKAYCMYLFGFVILSARTQRELDGAIQDEEGRHRGFIVVWRSEIR
jgi:hypothetical protein